MTSYEDPANSIHRLPWPSDDPVTPRQALQRLRARCPVEVDELIEQLPPDADALIWRASSEVLETLPTPWDFTPWRRLVGSRKLALDLTVGLERQAIQALSEAGFVLQRREILDSDPPRVWWVGQADENYRIRLCREDDEPTILELFTPLFHSARSARHWRWKYLQNPWGRRWISLAETRDGELAAHYAGYPTPFVRWRDGTAENLLAVQIGDTMTAPEHRQVGLGWTSLLGRAVRHHFARFGREGIAFYYGFNTGKIRNFNLRFIRGRWAGSVGFYRRSLPLEPTRRRHAGAARLELDHLPEREVDELFDRAGPAYRMLVRRDAAWLRWRYAECPDEPCFFAVALRVRDRLVGWGVFRRHLHPVTGRAQLRWVDAFISTEVTQAVGLLIAEALRQPEAQGVEEITAWFSPRPRWWVDALFDLGFERVAEPDDLGLIYLPFDDSSADATFLDLYYTWGDSDLT
ncbi:MAG: GNAT family N-acetyltransferase [Thermoanaerobaculia bacterium]|nr:GNAT family N-acetyltransferase [Thermoanaerobaculia bacterium]